MNRVEVLKEAEKQITGHREHGKNDYLAGTRVGYLSVIERNGRIKGKRVWKCLCLACGNEVDIREDRLKSGSVEQCGCMTRPGKIKFTCAYCGKEGEKVKRSYDCSDKHFCCTECYRAYLKENAQGRKPYQYATWNLDNQKLNDAYGFNITEKINICGEDEKWKRIGETYYEISNYGRVRTVEHTIMRKGGKRQYIAAKLLLPSKDEDGYLMVGINGKTIKIHKLVAENFCGFRGENEVIRHLDGNCRNNFYKNLKFGTLSQNSLDCYDYRGYISVNQKLSLSDVREILELLKRGVKASELAKRYNVSQQTISDIKHDRTYRHIRRD